MYPAGVPIGVPCGVEYITVLPELAPQKLAYGGRWQGSALLYIVARKRGGVAHPVSASDRISIAVRIRRSPLQNTHQWL